MECVGWLVRVYLVDVVCEEICCGVGGMKILWGLVCGGYCVIDWDWFCWWWYWVCGVDYVVVVVCLGNGVDYVLYEVLKVGFMELIVI